MTTRTFECYLCHKTFEVSENWTEEDAKKEIEKKMGYLPPAKDLKKVCDSCYTLWSLGKIKQI
jgi:hypothetical protein